MFKSLYSGVSGLSANLTKLDVIGNNIANSNTVGFKTGRVTFNEMLTQTLRSASRPVAGGLGGTNPQQVGLGTQVGSIDTNFNQGNFETTGKTTDLAIQGPGFFILSDGVSNSFTRAGVFGLDSQNYLVNPSTGMKVQGVMADSAGNIGTGPMGDIFIDPTLVVPAQPSSTVQLMGNLDSASDAKGSIMESPSFLVAATAADVLVDMSGQTDGTLNLNTGDEIRINGRVGGVAVSTDTFTLAEDSSYQDMVDWLNGAMTAAGQNITFQLDPAGSGALQVTNNTGSDLEGFSLSVTAKTQFNNNFTFPSLIASGDSALSSELRAYASADDVLSAMYDANGNPLDIDLSTPPGTLNLGGSVGGDPVENNSMDVTAATTLGELCLELQYALGINSNPVEVNEEGQIVVRGEVGTEAAIGDISVNEEGQINSVIESAFSFTQTQQAEDKKSFSMATVVYDSLGGEHSVNFSFEKIAGENEWIWTANMEGNEEILSGGSGRIRFADNGSISNFTYDDDSGALTFAPQNAAEEGAANVTLNIDYGDIGALTGLTQFEGSGNLQSIADGYGTGSLVDFTIDQSGTITGIFSNDTMQAIGRIGIAEFNNPDGLTRSANNTYKLSGNSGQALETFAGMGNGVTLVPGALETSNVDLAKEFTNLVVAQRAFQANSRVITTADQVMQELVNLVR
ncbi:MAG: flagellar hook-basal body complex protein [bacterium]